MATLAAACIGVQCAVNATCFATGTFTSECICDAGFEGDGINVCKAPTFSKYQSRVQR